MFKIFTIYYYETTFKEYNIFDAEGLTAIR